jgi:hypothetical protein
MVRGIKKSFLCILIVDIDNLLFVCGDTQSINMEFMVSFFKEKVKYISM